MINAAIYGMGRWGRVLVDSVQGKSDKIKFVTGISRSPEEHRHYAEETGLSVTDDFESVLAGIVEIAVTGAIVIKSIEYLRREMETMFGPARAAE